MDTIATISDNTTKQSETNQTAILNNINRLQQMETDLYNQLESSATVGANDSEKEAIINKINELSTMRMTMFSDLDITFKTTQGRVAKSRTDLVDQLATTRIMERDLNNAKAKLNRLQTSKANKMRMVEINTYYASKYKAQIGVMKLIIIMCVPLLILAIVSKKGLIPDSITKALIGIIIIIGTFFVMKQVSDIYSRNNMNFDEYDWTWDSSNTPSVYEYDKAQIASLMGGSSTLPSFDFSKTGCIGAECCSTGLYYDEIQKQCLVGSEPPASEPPASEPPASEPPASDVSTTEGFSGGRFTNARVAATGSTCPFKQMNTIVRPFNETQTNYVTVSAF